MAASLYFYSTDAQPDAPRITNVSAIVDGISQQIRDGDLITSTTAYGINSVEFEWRRRGLPIKYLDEKNYKSCKRAIVITNKPEMIPDIRKKSAITGPQEDFCVEHCIAILRR
jgi:hypothetical protein